jgi:hypothetical protein
MSKSNICLTHQTTYEAIQHVNPNRRDREWGPDGKGGYRNVTSLQVIRTGPRAVDIKRAERAAKKAAAATN